MQRLLALKLATSNLPKILPTTTTTSPIFHSQRHKTFSLAKPPQNHFFSSFPTYPPHHIPHPWRPQHTLAQKKSWVYLQPITQKSILSRFLKYPFESFKQEPLQLQTRNSQNPISRTEGNSNVAARHCLRLFITIHKRRSWFGRVSGEQVVSRLIVVANVAVFLLWRIAGHSFMMNNFTISLHKFGNGYIHTLITSAFSHIDAGHMFFNMVGLYFFEMNAGSFAKVVFSWRCWWLSLFLGAENPPGRLIAGQQPSNTHPAKVSGLGARGAINAIMLLDIFLFPRFTLLGIFLIGKDYLAIRRGDIHISGAAHLGGAAVAAVAWAQIRKGRLRF